MDSNNAYNTYSNDITNSQDNKKIDNRILTSKERMYEIDEKLDDAKKRLQNLSSMQENIESITKSMNKCIDLLSKSVNGPRVNNKFNDMRNSNKMFLVKASICIEEGTMAARKTINELYKEKDNILKENRNAYNQRQEQILKEREEMAKAKARIFKKEDNLFTEDIETKEE